eukprot:3527960-Prymnesium_polylepis.1
MVHKPARLPGVPPTSAAGDVPRPRAKAAAARRLATRKQQPMGRAAFVVQRAGAGASALQRVGATTAAQRTGGAAAQRAEAHGAQLELVLMRRIDHKHRVNKKTSLTQAKRKALKDDALRARRGLAAADAAPSGALVPVSTGLVTSAI